MQSGLTKLEEKKRGYIFSGKIAINKGTVVVEMRRRARSRPTKGRVGTR